MFTANSDFYAKHGFEPSLPKFEEAPRPIYGETVSIHLVDCDPLPNGDKLSPRPRAVLVFEIAECPGVIVRQNCYLYDTAAVRRVIDGKVYWFDSPAAQWCKGVAKATDGKVRGINDTLQMLSNYYVPAVITREYVIDKATGEKILDDRGQPRMYDKVSYGPMREETAKTVLNREPERAAEDEAQYANQDRPGYAGNLMADGSEPEPQKPRKVRKSK